jgi:hypothetical protein
MLLGPGMHYFEDVNVSIDPDEIILDSQGIQITSITANCIMSPN